MITTIHNRDSTYLLEFRCLAKFGIKKEHVTVLCLKKQCASNGAKTQTVQPDHPVPLQRYVGERHGPARGCASVCILQSDCYPFDNACKANSLRRLQMVLYHPHRSWCRWCSDVWGKGIRFIIGILIDIDNLPCLNC